MLQPGQAIESNILAIEPLFENSVSLSIDSYKVKPDSSHLTPSIIDNIIPEVNKSPKIVKIQSEDLNERNNASNKLNVMSDDSSDVTISAFDENSINSDVFTQQFKSSDFVDKIIDLKEPEYGFNSGKSTAMTGSLEL